MPAVRDLVTTVLDVVGLLLIAAGAAAGAAPWVGWGSLAVAGIVVLVGSAVAAWPGRRRDAGARR